MSQKDKPIQENALPRIHYVGIVSSSMDIAFDLIKKGRFPIWDSVVAKGQTAGRGQMRRFWYSQAGNLFASIRLPMEPPFDSIAAPVAVGALVCDVLRKKGCPVFLKWPNDIILVNKDVFGKLAGILLEERTGALVAGIGINIVTAPDKQEMRDDTATSASSIADNCKIDKLPKPSELWSSIVKYMYAAYNSKPGLAQTWQNLANDFLLWRNENVMLTENDKTIHGELMGINSQGGIIIRLAGEIVEKYAGELSRPH